MGNNILSQKTSYHLGICIQIHAKSQILIYLLQTGESHDKIFHGQGCNGRAGNHLMPLFSVLAGHDEDLN